MANDTSSRPTVVLLRSPGPDDPYVRSLSKAGFSVYNLPVLQFEEVDVEGYLAQLETGYDGLVFTSPRAASITVRVLEANASLAAQYANRVAYAVGMRTCSIVRPWFERVEGQESGRAADLAWYILQQRPLGRLLFPAGNRRREDLPRLLQEAGVTFDERCIYRTVMKEALEWPINPERLDWLVAFSPSGVETVTSVEAEDRLTARTRIGAIGPTSAAAWREAGYAVDAVADYPSPEALVEALASA